MKKQKRLTKKQIQAHLKAQNSSGLSVISYCKQHNLVKQTFYAWLSRYKALLSSKEAPEEFIELKVEPPIDAFNPVIAEIRHPNGFCVSFYKDCTSTFLAETIKQL